mmetsp:Transcript_39499/g.94606  ORF Transcript_39499/g.94606 Transcript_39499/m.94606 type:complete len:201 (+) Transcript_39499:550-1152(+)
MTRAVCPRTTLSAWSARPRSSRLRMRRLATPSPPRTVSRTTATLCVTPLRTPSSRMLSLMRTRPPSRRPSMRPSPGSTTTRTPPRRSSRPSRRRSKPSAPRSSPSCTRAPVPSPVRPLRAPLTLARPTLPVPTPLDLAPRLKRSTKLSSDFLWFTINAFLGWGFRKVTRGHMRKETQHLICFVCFWLTSMKCVLLRVPLV